jgi:predicted alpha/beta-hydrolase family hydrolase
MPMEEPFSSALIRGTLHRPDAESGDAFALTHGAGGNSNTPLLIKLARACADQGHLALRYDLPFRVTRSAGPPFPAGATRDREGIAAAIAAVRGMAGGRVIAGGHSYGGRQTSMLAAEQPGIADALLLLAYPLHPPHKPEQKRTAHLPNLRTPVLFVHGTADPFASPEELREAIALIPAPTDLLIVEGAAHNLSRAAGLATEILNRLYALLHR